MSSDTRVARRAWQPARWAVVSAIVLVVLLAGLVVGGPRFIQAHPDAVTNTVDSVRNIVGPGPVSAIENTYYRAVDAFDRFRYQATGQSTTWQLNAPSIAVAGQAHSAAGPAVAAPAKAAAAVVAKAKSAAHTQQAISAPARPKAAKASGTVTAPAVQAAVAQAAAAQASTVQAPAAAALEPLPVVTPILTSPVMPGEGVWQPLATLGQPAGQDPILWQTVIRPDPNRPYAAVALVAMDLSRSQVHVVAGTKEPASSVPGNGLRTGVIPVDVQAAGNLLAAWNGGFKAVHGHYGMMTDGTVWLPAQNGLATAAIDKQGHLTIGAWGRGVNPDKAWLAWRQNNPPLIENGAVNPDVIRLANTVKWGASLDGAVFIWRSGMGITPGGRWVIYAAGNSLSVQTLTTALQAAGTYNAMQLDVNMSFERYDVFRPTPQNAKVGGQDVTLPITAVKLINQMQGGSSQFLAPDQRDFFYLTARS